MVPTVAVSSVLVVAVIAFTVAHYRALAAHHRALDGLRFDLALVKRQLDHQYDDPGGFLHRIRAVEDRLKTLAEEQVQAALNKLAYNDPNGFLYRIRAVEHNVKNLIDEQGDTALELGAARKSTRALAEALDYHRGAVEEGLVAFARTLLADPSLVTVPRPTPAGPASGAPRGTGRPETGRPRSAGMSYPPCGPAESERPGSDRG